MEEHLENSSPLIIDEVHRWSGLLWDDYLDYKYEQKRTTDIDNPWGYAPYALKWAIRCLDSNEWFAFTTLCV